MSESKRDESVEVFEWPMAGHEPSSDAVAPKREEKKESADIESAPLKPHLAFERFAGKVFNGAGNGKDHGIHQGFSDRLEYNSLTAANRKYESPLERMNRLKAEVAEFQKEMEMISKQAESKESLGSLSNTLASELSQLDQQLQGVATNTSYQPFLQQEFNNSSQLEQKVLLNKLLSQIRSVGSGSTEAKEVKASDSGSGSGGGGITYELYYDGSKEKQRQQQGLAELDRRVAAVEQAVGAKNAETGLDYADIHSGIMYLNRRIDLLDQSKLDAISRRIRTLTADLEQIQQTRDKVQGEEKAQQQEKVNEIYQLMQKWDDAASQLPTVIGRLQSLKELHEQSAAVVLRAQAVDAEHTQVTNSLKSNATALEKVQKSMAENTEVMQRNVEALEKRMAELAQKMSQLS